MAKYDFEFKKKVVEAYLRGEGSYQTLSKKYGLKLLDYKCYKSKKLSDQMFRITAFW